MLANGDESEMANHAYSRGCCPLNMALSGDPVRIRPGNTVVTEMLSRASSVRRPSENPASANLLAEYGSRWGTAIRPPIDEMFTIRPAPWRRMNGSADVIM